MSCKSPGTNSAVWAQSNFLEHGNRSVVIGSGYGDDAADPQGVSPVGKDRCRSFGGITFGPVSRQERESHIDIGERLALHEATDSDRLRALPQAGEVQPEAEITITVDRSLQNVFTRVRQRPHPLVADEPQETRLVQQFQYELCVVQLELSKIQPRGLDDVLRSVQALRSFQQRLS